MTVLDIEVFAWLLLSILGLVTRLRSLSQARRNYLSMHAANVEQRMLNITADMLLSETLSAIGWLGFVLIGVVAEAIPRPPTYPTTPFGVVTGFALVFMVAVWFGRNLVDLRVNQRVRAESVVDVLRRDHVD